MIIRLLEPIAYAGATVPAGLYRATAAELHALAQRGRCRPATQDEIQHASGEIPVIGDAAFAAADHHGETVESAAAPPVTERAVAAPGKGGPIAPRRTRAPSPLLRSPAAR